MATTTNYGWTTPDDTALVKDGASAIRSLGTSVDTTTKNLNPSTTLGDIEYRSSTANTNTRLGIGSSGQVLTVAAGVPSWANGFSNPLTTTGDTIYSSSGSTPARLGIGTTGQVLTVSGGVPSWATVSAAGANYTLLNSGGTTLSGASTTVSGISGKENLLILFRDGTNASQAIVGIRINSDSTAGNYDYAGTRINGLSTYAANFLERESPTNASSIPVARFCDSGGSVSGALAINGGTQTGFKQFSSTGAGSSTPNQAAFCLTGIYKGTAAITSITVVNNTGSFTGGTVYVYGA